MNETTRKKLEHIGYKLGPYLGGGTYGDIYALDNSRALKITSDFSEASLSQKLIGKKLKNVCNIYRVFRFKNDSTTFFIEQERLQKIRTNLPRWSSSLNSSNVEKSFIKTKLRAKKILNSKNAFLQKKIKPIKKWTEKNYNDYLFFVLFYVSDFEYEYIMKLAKDSYTAFLDSLVYAIKYENNEVIHFKELYNGLLELKKEGIYFYDNHIGNVMQKDGVWKWVDIGGSEKKDTKKVELVENVNVVDIIRLLNNKELNKQKYIEELIKLLNIYNIDYKFDNVNIKDLQYNQRRIYRKKIDNLLTKINSVDDIYPIVIDKNNKILDGHHRVFAVREKFGNDIMLPVMIINQNIKELIYEKNKF